MAIMFLGYHQVDVISMLSDALDEHEGLAFSGLPAKLVEDGNYHPVLSSDLSKGTSPPCHQQHGSAKCKCQYKRTCSASNRQQKLRADFYTEPTSYMLPEMHSLHLQR